MKVQLSGDGDAASKGGFEQTDPRAALPTVVLAKAADPAVGFGTTQLVELADAPHDACSGLGWTVRSQNCFISYFSTEDRLDSDAVDIDAEHMLVVVSGTCRLVLSGTVDESHAVTAPSVICVPPSRSRFTLTGPGTVLRIVPVGAGTGNLAAVNAEYYARGTDARTASPVPWPAPNDGYRARIYPLDDAGDKPGVFGRIYRCSTIMVNVLPAQHGPRDPEKLSPHVHDDFEQCSVAVSGDYVHHCRTPWTPNLTHWREDEHLAAASPAIAIIPPGIYHTSQAVGSGAHLLIDVFAPPRRDFASMPGWVRNEADYPATDAS
jgi:hypothetical protein